MAGTRVVLSALVALGLWGAPPTLGGQAPLLVFSTYLGGTGVDQAVELTADAQRNVLVVGTTSSSGLPSLRPYGGGVSDAFVAKYDPAGQLLWFTFLGGNGEDKGHGIAVDDAGAVYVTGMTESPNFPLANPFQDDFVNQGGATSHAFVSKLDPAGRELIYSTFLGGTGDDSGNGIAVDGSGATYVCGWTTSSNFPLQNPFQSGSGFNAFLTKLAASGTSLIYSTHLGGGFGTDYAHAVAVDDAGQAYVAGGTTAEDFPLVNAVDTEMDEDEAFVAKFSSDGSSLIYSTWLGGVFPNWATGLAVDDEGNATIVGNAGPAFPLVAPLQTDQADIFTAKLGPRGALLYSTYFGGWLDRPGGVAVDASGASYVSGWDDDGATPGFEGKFVEDAFAGKLTPSGQGVPYFINFGGSGFDPAAAIAIDPDGVLLVAGQTYSSNFQLQSAAQPAYGGNADAFIAKIFPPDVVPLEVSRPGQTQLRFRTATQIIWEKANWSGSLAFNLYRGSLLELPAPAQGVCLHAGLTANHADEQESPDPGGGWFYLVSGVNAAGEGPLGFDSAGNSQIAARPCR